MHRLIALAFTLAVLATSCSASTTTTTGEPDAVASDDAPASTEAVSTPEPTATATPQAEPESTATPQPAADSPDDDEDTTDGDPTAVIESSPFGNLSPSELACVVSGLADDPTLFANAVASADYDDLGLDDQVDTALIALDCAPEAAAAEFAQSFAEDMTQADPAMGVDLGECLVDQMSEDNPNRRDLLMGFAILDESGPMPPEANDALVDSISTCVPGPVFAEWLIAEFADDPRIGDALDTDCVRTAFPDDSIRQFWASMISSGGAPFDELDPAESAPWMNSLFSCLSMGRILAAEAAADGVELSDETIACIDAEMAGTDVAALMAGGDDAAGDEIGVVILQCLSPEELIQMMGDG